MPFPQVPASVKGIAHFLKAADEHDQRNVVISYWCRMYACQVAMKIVPGKKPPDVSALLIALMDWLEETKKGHPDLDGIANETAAQAIIEEYAIHLFNYADSQDRAENFNKNMVKAFYTAGILMDVLQQFGELSEDIFNKRKYAKWKAAYIHNCLKFGDTPVPGPPGQSNDDSLIHKSELESEETGEETPAAPAAPVAPTLPTPPPANTIPQPTWPSFPSPNPAPMPNLPSVSPQQTPLLPAPSSTTTPSLSALQIEKAQKYCKWAASALNYEDIKTAVDNLQKALDLLQHGRDE